MPTKRDPHDTTQSLVEGAAGPSARVKPTRNDGYLVVFDRETGWRYALPASGAIIIGRGAEADLQLHDNAVSRQHARIDVDARGGTRIVDLGSHNGVVVNGERVVGERALGSHDVVMIGHVTLVFRAAGNPATEAGAAEPSGEAVRRDVGGRAVIIADPAMTRIYALLERLAASDLSVLIRGETGTGKEVAAAAVHAWSRRASKPFVAINCAAIPANLAESELLGYEKGAFSGAQTAKPGLLESAHGGTVFLDEIGELPTEVQAKLLRVLDTRRATRLGDLREREIDVRIVAATNADLEADTRSGRFRKDLFFRLNGATVWLPPLRDRGREILLLAQEFLDVAAPRAGRGRLTLSPEAQRLLVGHSWPGNIRELRNVMEFLAATAAGEVILAGEAAARLASPVPESGPPADEGRSLDEEVRDLERKRMRAALDACEGNQTRAAASIGMPLRTFVTKLKAYGLARPRE